MTETNPLDAKTKVRSANGPAYRECPERFSSTSIAYVVFVLGALSCILSQSYAGGMLVSEDSYISLRYVSNWLAGHGLVFNVGERVQGFSNPSWVGLLCLFGQLGLDPTVAAWSLGALCSGLTSALTFTVSRRLSSTAPALVATGLFLIFAPSGCLYSAGLETSMMSALTLVVIHRALSEGARGQRSYFVDGVFLGLLAISRPDGVLICLALLAARWIGRTSLTPRQTGVLLLPLIAALVAYALFGFLYYGNALPNTYFVKAGLGWRVVERGLRFVGEHGLIGGGLLMIPIAIIGYMRADLMRKFPANVPLVIYLISAIYFSLIGVDGLPQGRRMWFAILPLLCVAVSVGLRDPLVRLLSTRAWHYRATLVICAGMVASHAVLVSERADLARVLRVHSEMADHFRQVLPDGGSLSLTAVGQIPFELGPTFSVLDQYGLNDAHIAHLPLNAPGKRRYGHEKQDPLYVLRSRPDLLMIKHSWIDTIAIQDATGEQLDAFYAQTAWASVVGTQEWHQYYRPVSVALGGGYMNYYRRR